MVEKSTSRRQPPIAKDNPGLELAGTTKANTVPGGGFFENSLAAITVDI